MYTCFVNVLSLAIPVSERDGEVVVGTGVDDRESVFLTGVLFVL